MKVNFEQAYECLGRMYYGLAFSGRPQRDEVARLKDSLDGFWKEVVKGDETIHRTLIDKMLRGVANAYEEDEQPLVSMEYFQTYFENHKLSFSVDLVQRIMQAADLVAAEFNNKYSRNKVNALAALLGVLLQRLERTQFKYSN